MPSSALAAMIHSQLGAHMIMNGTGRPISQPRTSTRLRPQASASCPEHEIGQRLDHPEADDEGDDERRRCDAEFFRSDERHDRSLNPDHAADEGIDQNEQGELPPVAVQPEPDRPGASGCAQSRRRFAHLRLPRPTAPEFAAPQRAASGGGGGMSASMNADELRFIADPERLRYDGFSKPMVDQGLPLKRRPQTEPAYAPGKPRRSREGP